MRLLSCFHGRSWEGSMSVNLAEVYDCFLVEKGSQPRRMVRISRLAMVKRNQSVQQIFKERFDVLKSIS
jgi:hypothetical protein